MLARLRQFLAPPSFEDEDRSHLARLLNTILIALLAMTLVSNTIVVILVSDRELSVIAHSIVMLFGLGAFWLIRQGRVRLASYFFISAIWIAITLLAVFYGGVGGHTYSADILVILIAGLLLGGRAGLTFAGLSILAGLAMLYIQLNGLTSLSFEPAAPTETWLTKTVCFGFAAVLLHLFVQDLDKALARAHRNERELLAEVAERRRSEEELQRLKEINESIVQNMAEGIVVEEGGIITLVNPNAAALLGYTPQELQGQHWTIMVPPDQQHIVRAANERRKRGITDRYELELLRKNNTRLSVLVSGRPFSEREDAAGTLAVFTDITEQVGAKKELQKAKEKLEKQNFRLAALYRVGQMINSTLDTDLILNRLTDAALRMTDATHGQVLVVHEENGCFERRVLRGFSPNEAQLARNIPLRLDQGVNGRAYMTRQTVYMADAQAESAYFSLIPTTRAELVVPIVRDERVLGNLDLQSPEPDAFRDADQKYLSALADQAAIALTNAQLFAETRRRLDEQTALREAGAVISSALDLETVLNRIAEQMGDAVDATSAYICSFVQKPGKPTYAVLAEYLGPEACARERVSDLGVTYVEDDIEFIRMLETGQPAIEHREDPVLAQSKADHMEQYGARSVLYVPLHVKGHLIGFAELWESRRRREFTPEQITLCQGIAQQAAIAIENARLYEQAQQEINERRRAEDALRESNETLLTVLNSIDADIYVADLNTYEILFMNNHMQKTFGEGLVGKLCWREFRKDSGPCAHCTNDQLLNAEGNPTGLHVWETQNPITGKFYINYDRAIRWVDGRLVRLQVATDITQRAQMEKALETYAARLEQSNRELEEFAYIASHDLREPLRKVQVFGDRLKDKYSAALDDRGCDYVDRMQNATARMQDLIDSLLTYSRVTTRAQPFALVDLSQVADEVLTDLGAQIQSVGGRVEIGDLPSIDADPTQMRQLFQNLVSNALKFHRPGEAPVINIQCRFLNGQERPCSGENSDDALVQITFKDDGIGFEEKYLDVIFQMFHRLHGRGEYEGSGIGLATCRKIATRHGGNITAKSKPGQGATFIVTLPTRQRNGENGR